MIKNPRVYRARRAGYVVPGCLLALELRQREERKQQAKLERAKHPRKKCPKHVRISVLKP